MDNAYKTLPCIHCKLDMRAHHSDLVSHRKKETKRFLFFLIGNIQRALYAFGDYRQGENFAETWQPCLLYSALLKLFNTHRHTRQIKEACVPLLTPVINLTDDN